MIKVGDLINVLKNVCYIDYYKPKSGTEEEITVVNFFISEDSCYEELSKFLYYSSYDILNTDMKPNIDNDDYIVFIELHRDEKSFNNILKICRDFSNLNNAGSWTIKMYPDKTIKIPQKYLGAVT